MALPARKSPNRVIGEKFQHLHTIYTERPEYREEMSRIRERLGERNPTFYQNFSEVLVSEQLPQKVFDILQNPSLNPEQRRIQIKKIILEHQYVRAMFQVRELNDAEKDVLFKSLFGLISKILKQQGKIAINSETNKPFIPVSQVTRPTSQPVINPVVNSVNETIQDNRFKGPMQERTVIDPSKPITKGYTGPVKTGSELVKVNDAPKTNGSSLYGLAPKKPEEIDDLKARSQAAKKARFSRGAQLPNDNSVAITQRNLEAEKKQREIDDAFNKKEQEKRELDANVARRTQEEIKDYEASIEQQRRLRQNSENTFDSRKIEGNDYGLTQDELVNNFPHVAPQPKDSSVGITRKNEDARERIRQYQNPDIKLPNGLVTNYNGKSTLERKVERNELPKTESVNKMISDYELHLDLMISMGKMKPLDKVKMLEFFKKQIANNEAKARKMLEEITKRDESRKTNLESERMKSQKERIQKEFNDLIKSIDLQFERFKDFSIDDIKTVYDLIVKLRSGSPTYLTRLNQLADSLKFKAKDSLLTVDMRTELEDKELLIRKYVKIMNLVIEVPDKFEKDFQELFYWMSDKKDLDHSNLELFVNSVIANTKRPSPEFCDLEDWNKLNSYANSQNLFGTKRLEFLRSFNDPKQLQEFLKSVFPEKIDMPKPEPMIPLNLPNEVPFTPEVYPESLSDSKPMTDEELEAKYVTIGAPKEIGELNGRIKTTKKEVELRKLFDETTKLATKRIESNRKIINSLLTVLERLDLDSFRTINKNLNISLDITRVKDLTQLEFRSQEAIKGLIDQLKITSLDKLKSEPLQTKLQLFDYILGELSKLENEELLKANKTDIQTLISKIKELQTESLKEFDKLNASVYASKQYKRVFSLTRDLDSIKYKLFGAKDVEHLLEKANLSEFKTKLNELKTLLETVKNSVPKEELERFKLTYVDAENLYKTMELVSKNKNVFVGESLTSLFEYLTVYKEAPYRAFERAEFLIKKHTLVSRLDLIKDSKDINELLNNFNVTEFRKEIELFDNYVKEKNKDGLYFSSDDLDLIPEVLKRAKELSSLIDYFVENKDLFDEKIFNEIKNSLLEYDFDFNKLKDNLTFLIKQKSLNKTVVPGVIETPEVVVKTIVEEDGPKLKDVLPETKEIVSKLDVVEVDPKQLEAERRRIVKISRNVSRKLGLQKELLDEFIRKSERTTVPDKGQFVLEDLDFTLVRYDDEDNLVFTQMKVSGTPKIYGFGFGIKDTYVITNKREISNLNGIFSDEVTSTDPHRNVNEPERVIGIIMAQKDGSLTVYRLPTIQQTGNNSEINGRKQFVDLLKSRSQVSSEQTNSESTIKETPQETIELDRLARRQARSSKRLNDPKVQARNAMQGVKSKISPDDLLSDDDLARVDERLKAQEAEDRRATEIAADNRFKGPMSESTDTSRQVERVSKMGLGQEYSGEVPIEKAVTKFEPKDPKTQINVYLERLPKEKRENIMRILKSQEIELTIDPINNPLIEVQGPTMDSLIIPSEVLGNKSFEFKKNELVILGRNEFTVVYPDGRVETMSLNPPLAQNISRLHGMFMLTDKGLVFVKLSKFRNTSLFAKIKAEVSEPIIAEKTAQEKQAAIETLENAGLITPKIPAIPELNETKLSNQEAEEVSDFESSIQDKDIKDLVYNLALELKSEGILDSLRSRVQELIDLKKVFLDFADKTKTNGFSNDIIIKFLKSAKRKAFPNISSIGESVFGNVQIKSDNNKSIFLTNISGEVISKKLSLDDGQYICFGKNLIRYNTGLTKGLFPTTQIPLTEAVSNMFIILKKGNSIIVYCHNIS